MRSVTVAKVARSGKRRDSATRQGDSAAQCDSARLLPGAEPRGRDGVGAGTGPGQVRAEQGPGRGSSGTGSGPSRVRYSSNGAGTGSGSGQVRDRVGAEWSRRGRVRDRAGPSREGTAQGPHQVPRQ
ncbi:unnamed protein product [Closterium sp. NIES-54]